MTEKNLAALRREYQGQPLNEADAAAEPLAQFQRWFDEAVAAQTPMVNAMTLATVNTAGQPSARVVLLKGVDQGGFVFYTNYASRKGRELEVNPRAALVFYWSELEREIRIEGSVTRTSAAEADAYFDQRPLGSRHAAIASPQSETVADRATLEQRFAAAAQLGDRPHRPAHWGGYRLSPATLEFWQGRPNRLHDRLLYTREAGRWKISRLAP